MSVKDRPMSVKMGDGFKDQGHLRYYASSTSRCGLKKEEKRRMKLVKGLEKDLSALYSMGFGVERGEGIAGEVKDQIMSVSFFNLSVFGLVKFLIFCFLINLRRSI